MGMKLEDKKDTKRKRMRWHNLLLMTEKRERERKQTRNRMSVIGKVEMEIQMNPIVNCGIR